MALWKMIALAAAVRGGDDNNCPDRTDSDLLTTSEPVGTTVPAGEDDRADEANGA